MIQGSFLTFFSEERELRTKAFLYFTYVLYTKETKTDRKQYCLAWYPPEQNSVFSGCAPWSTSCAVYGIITFALGSSVCEQEKPVSKQKS